MSARKSRESWKQLLFDHYVSSGQANVPAGLPKLSSFPYFTGLIRRFVPDRKDLRIADLACGNGTLVFCLRASGYQCVTGVDVSAEQVALAHELGIHEVTCASLESFLEQPGQSFDLIFMMDILEHLRPEEFFAIMDRVYATLAKDGILIAHVPNGAGLFGMSVRYGDLTHETSFTARSLSQSLQIIGFENVQAVEDLAILDGFGGLLRYFLWRMMTFPARLLYAVEKGFGGAKGLVLTQNMTVIAHKK